MKKFFNKVQNKANELAIRAKSTIDNARAEGYIDTGVKIIIGVVDTISLEKDGGITITLINQAKIIGRR